MAKKVSKVEGWPSFKLQNDQVEACITELGGHLAPVVFDREGKKIQPYSVAPWCCDKLPNEPNVIQVLRGDFFCMPFGGNADAYRGEKHQVHGDTANLKWTFVGQDKNNGTETLHLKMKTKARPGQVDKYISIIDGQNAVYSKHVITGMSGQMPLGHHATLKFPDYPGSGLLSTSKIVHAQVFVEPTEKPEEKGYSILKPGAVFKKLSSVPMITGEKADLSAYPARRGFEDIAILVADPQLDLAWTAVSYPKEGYVWFALKNPKMLASTLMWMSNGGRHYAPWNSRHVNVMGLEEITAFFHMGLKASVTKNSLADAGYQTALKLSKSKPTVINYIMACVPVAKGFDRVKSIKPSRDHSQVTITADNGKSVTTGIDIDFLYG